MSRTALLLSALLAAAPRAWSQITVIDPTANVQSTSITIGGDGFGLVAYVDYNLSALKVAHCHDVACTSATLTTLANPVNGTVSIMTGVDGLGLIAYRDSTTGEARVAHCSDAECASATSAFVASGSAPHSIAKAPDGFGLVAFKDTDLKLAHCQDASCDTSVVVAVPCPSPYDSSVVTGSDGLSLVECSGFVTYPAVVILHCDDPSCTTSTSTAPLQFLGDVSRPHLVLGGDGLGFFTIDLYYWGQDYFSVVVFHCDDVACSTNSAFDVGATTMALPVTGSDGLPRVLLALMNGQVEVMTCLDPSCGSHSMTPTALPDGIRSVTLAPDGDPLVALKSGGLAVAHCLSPDCASVLADVSASVTDGVATAAPGHAITYTIVVSNAGPGNAVGVHVMDLLQSILADATWTCVASPGSSCPSSGSGSIDHAVDVAAGGALTYILTATVDGAATGSLVNTVSATVGPLHTDPAPGNNSVTDTDALDAPVSVSVAGSVAPESSGIASFDLSLSRDSLQSVTVDWATTAGTATAGVDYLPASGSLTFPPGVITESIGVTVVDDHRLGLGEDFGLQLSSPGHAVLGTSQATDTILDDDSPNNELVQGSDRVATLVAWPGPEEHRDYFLISTPVHSSWEVVVDSTSADIVPVVVERLDSDTLATLQAANPVAGGSSVSLRWENSGGAQLVSVRSGGCTVDCGAGTPYRIRARETTCAIPRFNNTGTQVTLVVIQNTSGAAVHGTLMFWETTGALLVAHPFVVSSRAAAIVDTTSLGLSGQQGSITVSHDGPFGSLTGKAVSLEPATGFAFDTPMQPRLR